MNGREKLIDLLDDGCYKACSDASGKKVNEVLADYLLENGVTILPCKVGDILYSIWEDDNGVLQIDETEIEDVSTRKIWVNGGGFDIDCLGKSDFLSREDAEKEIARRYKR
ncbi:MAG: hypothetical protein U0K91_10895 [Acutalibacteraceae bacterium]|nr:hypothetical protein [Acutalibacteraceae bacterium]